MAGGWPEFVSRKHMRHSWNLISDKLHIREKLIVLLSSVNLAKTIPVRAVCIIIPRIDIIVTPTFVPKHRGSLPP